MQPDCKSGCTCPTVRDIISAGRDIIPAVRIRLYTDIKKEETAGLVFRLSFRSPLILNAAAAYSPTWSGSTIGASELNFSVRYG